MLKLKYMIENFDLAKEALAYFEHDDEKLDEMLSYFRISSNAVYPYLNKGELWFLRLTPIDEIAKNNFFGELDFIEHLIKRGYNANCFVLPSVPQPLATSFGSYYAVAFKGVSGNQIEELEYSDEIWFAYGKSLAELHMLSENYEFNTRKWSWKDALDWGEGIISSTHVPEKMMMEVAEVRRSLQTLPMSDYGLVHYDFEPDNVFYDAATGECWVIDFNDGMYHWYALDIAQVFGCIEDDIDENFRKQAKDHFISGYRSKRFISDEMISSIPLMNRFINIFGYARLLHCLSDIPETRPAWMENLIMKLEYMLRVKESMVE